MQQAGLAGAGRADQGNLFARRDDEVQLAQGQRIGGGAGVVDAEFVKVECHAWVWYLRAGMSARPQGKELGSDPAGLTPDFAVGFIIKKAAYFNKPALRAAASISL